MRLLYPIALLATTLLSACSISDSTPPTGSEMLRSEVADSILSYALPLDELPEQLSYLGTPTHAFRYRDIEGEHLALFTASEGEHLGEEITEGSRDYALYAYGYTLQPTGPTLTWDAQDFVVGCPFDNMLRLLPGSIHIADLDDDGLASVSFAYTIGCRSDVSADGMKVLLYEGERKYAIRGMRRLKMGGAFQNDAEKHLGENFDNAPDALQTHLLKLWDMYEVEEM